MKRASSPKIIRMLLKVFVNGLIISRYTKKTKEKTEHYRI